MRVALKPHPESAVGAAVTVDVDYSAPRRGVTLLRYLVRGEDAQSLALPAAAEGCRADELWRHTCFELFVRTPGGYYEFNFSPSSQWAAYRFDSYREGMRTVEAVTDVSVTGGLHPDGYELNVRVDLSGLADMDRVQAVALTAILETTDGDKSYWALAHAPGKPDFHHPDTFETL